MKKYSLRLLITALMFSSCSKTEEGAVGGAIVGVGVGAAIGGGGGALIGGAIGAASGAIIGAALDDSDREKLNQSSPETLKKLDHQQHLTKQDVINMSNAGLTDEVIIDQIHATHSKFLLSNQEIMDLKNQGVSQTVIHAMIQTKQKS